MRRKPFQPVWLVLCLSWSLAVSADWYLGGNAGLAMSDVGSSELTARLAAEGIAGTATVKGSNRLGWRLFGGYQLHDYLALEAGYTNLGDIGFSTTEILNTEQIEAVRPASGAGLEVSVLGQYPLNAQWNGMIRAGLFSWQADYRLDNGDKVSFKGSDLVMGLGAQYLMNPRWSLRVAWDRYRVAHDDTDLLSLGLHYRFASAKVTGAPVALAQAPIAVALPQEPMREEVYTTPAVIEPVMEAAQGYPRQWVLLFAFDDIEPLAADESLREVAELFLHHPHTRLNLSGYTDSLGDEIYNRWLSHRRAEVVAERLMALGIDPQRMHIEGKGRDESLTTQADRQARMQSRRVVITAEER